MNLSQVAQQKRAARGATAVDKVVDELKQYDFEIISTDLPAEREQQLREVFAQE